MTDIIKIPNPFQGTVDDRTGRTRMVLAGGRGFLGSLIARYYLRRGWDVVVLSRKVPVHGNSGDPAPRFVQWDGQHLGPWCRELDGARVLVNLTGKSVNCRYNRRNRSVLLDSRLGPTHLLGHAVRTCLRPPTIWMNASTATLYRHTFGEPWDESGAIGAHPDAKDAFSVELARAWESAFRATPAPGVRKILLRSAMVFGRGSDANNVFATLRRLTRLGLGGQMATGRQYVSWIHERDFCRAIDWLIEHPEIEGAVNLAAPNPVPNREMMAAFREAFGIPLGMPATRGLLELGAFFLRTETELVIKSRRVIPGMLLESGFRFEHPTLPEAIRELRGARPQKARAELVKTPGI